MTRECRGGEGIGSGAGDAGGAGGWSVVETWVPGRAPRVIRRTSNDPAQQGE
ncbi:hypothetical protein [Streptomyces platensis]|uniref:hypothetical protein n=1 Tax=Streptomyces platensis TaxID=58346 RepID=UPI0036CC45BA